MVLMHGRPFLCGLATPSGLVTRLVSGALFVNPLILWSILSWQLLNTAWFKHRIILVGRMWWGCCYRAARTFWFAGRWRASVRFGSDYVCWQMNVFVTVRYARFIVFPGDWCDVARWLGTFEGYAKRGGVFIWCGANGDVGITRWLVNWADDAGPELAADHYDSKPLLSVIDIAALYLVEASCIWG